MSDLNVRFTGCKRRKGDHYRYANQQHFVATWCFKLHSSAHLYIQGKRRIAPWLIWHQRSNQFFTLPRLHFSISISEQREPSEVLKLSHNRANVHVIKVYYRPCFSHTFMRYITAYTSQCLATRPSIKAYVMLFYQQL